MIDATYIIETNGENGIHIQYQRLDYIPQDVVWNSGNTYPEGHDLPDAELSGSPDYVRRFEAGEYVYYRRVVAMPSKTATFSLYVLLNDVPVEYTYEDYSSFLTLFRQGNTLLVKSNTNISGNERNGIISIAPNIGGKTLIVPIVQEYTPIGIQLLSYAYEGMEGDRSGLINDVSYMHTFHWLTSKNSPDMETLVIDIMSIGPRNGYIIRDVSKYVYSGEVDEHYVVSGTDGGVYGTALICSENTFTTVSEPVIFDEFTQSLFSKAKYDNDLKITRDGSFVKITNYGRCFLQEDAYYVITLSNVDDLNDMAKIVVRYENDDMAAQSGDEPLVNPRMWLEEGCVMLYTDNYSDADEHFNYYVSFANGQLVYNTDMPETILSRIDNNQLITEV